MARALWADLNLSTAPMKPPLLVLHSYVACIMNFARGKIDRIVRLLRSPEWLQVEWGPGAVLLGQGLAVALLNMQLAEMRTSCVC